MYRVVTRLRRRFSNLANKAMFGVYLIVTLAGVGGLDGTLPFWPCALMIASGTLLSLKAGKEVVFGD